jgi:hypothetical protein
MWLPARGGVLECVEFLEMSEGGCQGGWELKVSGGELKEES